MLRTVCESPVQALPAPRRAGGARASPAYRGTQLSELTRPAAQPRLSSVHGAVASSSNWAAGPAPTQRFERLSVVSRASASEASESTSQQAPETAEALLTEFGVPSDRIEYTLAAAKVALTMPAEDRALLLFTDEGALVEGTGPESTAATVAPWEGTYTRASWLAQTRAILRFLVDLGLTREEVGDVVSRNPHLLSTPRDEMQSAVAFLQSLGLEDPAQLAQLVSAAPRLLCFSVSKHLQPSIEYLEAAGIARPVLLSLFREQPAFVLSAVDHKVTTDKAASLIKAAYMVQNEQRMEYALKAAAEIRATLKQSGGFSWG